MRKLPAYDPYLDTILCIRSAHHSPDEEAALIQNVFDALHLVQHRRPKRAAPVVEPCRKCADSSLSSFLHCCPSSPASRRPAMRNEVSPVGPLAGEVVNELLTPMMAYAELLKDSGRKAESKMVWVMLENLDRRLCALFIDNHRQAPQVRLHLPDLN